MKRLAAVALALLCACTSTGTQRHAGAVVDQQHEPIALNPLFENGAISGEFSALLFSYLLKSDDRGQLVPDVALAVPSLQNGGISADGMTVTYHLRRDVRFSDGTPLTARDCAFTIRTVLDPKNNVQSRYGYDRIARVDVPDPYTLVLHLREPFAPLLTLVLAPQGFPILPEHVLAHENDLNHASFNAMPIGSGPYVVRAWNRGDSVELAPNPLYFGRKPSLERLTLRFVTDAHTAINQLRTGEADILFNDENMGDYDLIASVPGVTAMRPRVDGVGALIFNTSDPVTNDAAVRRALSMAIDTRTLVQKTYRGAVDASDAGRGLFQWAYSAADSPQLPYDPAAARAALDAAGWKLGTDGVRHKGSQTLNVLLVLQAHTAGDEGIGAAIREYERAIGVNVTLKTFNITQFAAPASMGGPVYGGAFTMALYPFINGDDPDVTDQFSCATIPPHGFNKSRYCSAHMDELLRRGRTTYDRAQRMAAYAEIQHELAREMPLVLFYQRRQVDGVASRLRGVTVSPSQTSAFWNAAQWRLTDAQRP